MRLSSTQWINQYEIIATDSCGCVSGPSLVYEIRVLSTGIDELDIKKNQLNIRQEGEMIYFNNPLKQKASVSIYSTDGSTIHYFNIADNQININNILNTKGIYIIKILVAESVGSHKILNL